MERRVGGVVSRGGPAGGALEDMWVENIYVGRTGPTGRGGARRG